MLFKECTRTATHAQGSALCRFVVALGEKRLDSSRDALAG